MRSHAILVPGRASAVLVWVGAAVAGALVAWRAKLLVGGLAGATLRWVKSAWPAWLHVPAR